MWFVPNGRLSAFRVRKCLQKYVLDCLKDNPPRIRNIKQYLLTALYNAPLTIENYYAAQIDHDLCGGKR